MEEIKKNKEETPEKRNTYLEKLETLLEEQRAQNKKLVKAQRIQGIALIALVLVFTIGIVSINIKVSTAVENVPNLVNVATTSVESTTDELKQLLDEVNAIDFKQINETVSQANESISSIDIESLNQSIDSLNQIVEKMARFFGVSPK